MIQASIPEVYRSLFDYQFVEGNIYVISKLSVRYSIGHMFASYQKLMLEFVLGTQVRLAWAYGMPITGGSFDDNVDTSKRYVVGELDCLF
jgi:hypothetical protein